MKVGKTGAELTAEAKRLHDQWEAAYSPANRNDWAQLTSQDRRFWMQLAALPVMA